MNHSKAASIICTCILFLTAGLNPANAVQSTSQAYDFKLPYLIGKDSIQLSEMLPEKQFTVLIFFNSECDACLFTLDELKDSPKDFSEMGFSAQVIAVNNDTEDLGRSRAFVKGTGLTFPVLSDKKKRVTSAYGCDGYSFSSFVIDRTGRILDVHYDKRDHMLDYLIEVMIKFSTQAAQLPLLPSTGADESPVQFRGWGKIRMANVSASQNQINGLYGESLEEGGDISHRFFLEATTNLNEHFTFGALLRLSDEDDKVLLNGPVYLKNEFGSVFGQASFGGASVRLGYYDIFFTPLTLMRFDPEDLPEMGGSGGCGTCTSSGGLIGGSLMEDIDEKLTFEGGIAKFEYESIDAELLYARSQQAVEEERYRRHTVGARLRFQHYLPHARDFFQLSVQYLFHDDDYCSVDEKPAYYPLTNHVGGLYLNLPIFRSVGVFGEWAMSSLEQRFPCQSDVEDTARDGFAGTLGINIGPARGINGQLAYLYREKDFESLFSALTYLSNRHGGRVSVSWDVTEQLSLDVFGKYLEEIDAADDFHSSRYISLSTGVSIIPMNDLSVRLSCLSELQKRKAGVYSPETDTRVDAVTLQSSYELLQDNYLNAKYQFINYSDEMDSETDYDAHIISLEMNIKF